MHVLSSCSRGNCAQTRHAQGCQSGWAVCIMHVGGILGCCFISERLDTDGDGGRSSYKTELSGLTAEAHLCVSLCLLWEQPSVLLFVKIYRKSSGICPQTLMGRRGKGRLGGVLLLNGCWHCFLAIRSSEVQLWFLMISSCLQAGHRLCVQIYDLLISVSARVPARDSHFHAAACYGSRKVMSTKGKKIL